MLSLLVFIAIFKSVVAISMVVRDTGFRISFVWVQILTIKFLNLSKPQYIPLQRGVKCYLEDLSR